MLPDAADSGQARPSRVAALDVLRAIAALLVVWTHVCEDFVKLPYPAAHGGELHDVAWTFDFGRAGVVAFFATSGFLIPSGLREGSGATIRRFVVRRFFRLYPAYWLSVAAGWTVLWHLYGRVLSTRALLCNLTMAPGALGETRVLGLYWTLETELVFYLACVGAHALGVLRSTRWLFAIAAGLLATFLAFFAQNFFAVPIGLRLTHDQGLLCLHLSIMFGGALVRRLLDEGGSSDGPRGTTRLGWLGVGALTALLLGGFVAPGLVLGYGARHDAWLVRFAAPYGLGVALFSMALAWRWPARRAMTRALARALVRVGEASYSLYLFHPVVLGLSLVLVHGPHGAPLREFPLGAYLIAIGLASAALARLVFRWVEEPAQRWARAREKVREPA